MAEEHPSARVQKCLVARIMYVGERKDRGEHVQKLESTLDARSGKRYKMRRLPRSLGTLFALRWEIYVPVDDVTWFRDTLARLSFRSRVCL